jgi:hypothetical protein
MYWWKIYVYNHNQIIGSFYTQEGQYKAQAKEVAEKFSDWTRFIAE